MEPSVAHRGGDGETMRDDHCGAAARRHGLHWGKVSEPSGGGNDAPARTWSTVEVDVLTGSDGDDSDSDTDEQGVERKVVPACKICAGSTTLQHVPLTLGALRAALRAAQRRVH